MTIRSNVVRILAFAWAESIATYSLSVMQDYLTNDWGLNVTKAAAILNILTGISMISEVFFKFVADTYVGHFTVLVISSIVYNLGIVLITMSSLPTHAKSTIKLQRVLLYVGMALAALARTGHDASEPHVLEDEGNHSSKYNSDKLTAVPEFLALVLGTVIGIKVTNELYWPLSFGIPAIALLVTTIIFLSGWKTYRKFPPQRWSPITTVCRVFVASALKRFSELPRHTNELYVQHGEERQKYSFIREFRCLEKAAIILEDSSLEDQKKNRWKLCSVAEVEEAKFALCMMLVPVLLIIWGIVSSTGDTYFIQQAASMDPHIGTLRLPVQILILFQSISKFTHGALIKWLLNRPPKSSFPPQWGIAMGMVLSIFCCITSWLVEKRRLKVTRANDLLYSDGYVPMSMCWLVFQFWLLGGLNSIFEKSIVAFYGHYAPDSMKKYAEHYSNAVAGVGSLCAPLSVYTISRITYWFEGTLNLSRLDNYYLFLGAFALVNLGSFMAVAYTFFSVQRDQTTEATDQQGNAPLETFEVESEPEAYIES